ncbi:MAG: ABC transporter ATP-binding protein [Deferrisomatales bacterium]
MIRLEGVSFAYGGEPVLREVDLEVARGEIFGVLGPNGCGKSTLLRLVRGALRPDRGRILLEGRPVGSYRRREVARRVAVVPQAMPAPFPYSVREVVAMGRFAHGGGLQGVGGLGERDRRHVERALALTDTLHLAGRPVTELSGGELQRVILARALAQDAPILLLDEATSHLDLDHRLELAGLLTRLNREKATTVVQVSHDVDLVADTSQRLVLLSRDGRVVAAGPPERVVTADHLRRVFGVDVVVETNPFTGRPRVLPLVHDGRRSHRTARVHLICGGGGGAEILRRLHLLGCRLTAGPLNRGDLDHSAARALDVPVAEEEPFCPVSHGALERARRLAGRVDALVVAPIPWGPGNLGCLTLAEEALSEGTPAFLVDPLPERDFTGGRAWRRIEGLRASGARFVPDTEALIQALIALAPDREAGAKRAPEAAVGGLGEQASGRGREEVP